MSSTAERYRWLLPVFLLTVLAHGVVLQYWFVASDTLPLIETSRAAGLGGVVGLFTQPLMAGSDFVNTALFYRPVASLSYALDYAVWGVAPFGYHLTNLVLHATAVVLAAVAVTSLTDRPAVGALTAVLFAVHPVTSEVVPVTARRQDVLLTVFALATIVCFVRWYRGLESTRRTTRDSKRHWWLAGALLAYALALGSKETGVVVGGLVAVWVALQTDLRRPRRALRTLGLTVAPFAGVTVAYLVVRTVVLGGFGGYRVEAASIPPHDAGNVLLFAVKYVLWLTYPLNAIEEGAAMLPGGSVALVVLIPLFLLVGWGGVRRLARRGYFHRREFFRLRVVSPVGTVVAFAAIPVVLATKGWFEALVLPSASTTVVSYVVGVLFVGACVGGIVTATLIGDSSFDGAIHRQAVFFGCWAVAPLVLLMGDGFVTSRPRAFGFGIRNGYFAVVPAMAVLSLLLVPTLRKIRAELSATGRLGGIATTDTARAVGLCLLVVPLVVASPVFHSNTGWRAAGELNHQSLGGLSDGLEDMPNETPVYIADFPNGFDENQRSFPHAHSVTPLRPYSVEAWLELHGRPANTQVRLVRKRTVAELPAEVSFRTEDRNGWIAVWTTTSDDADGSGGG